MAVDFTQLGEPLEVPETPEYRQVERILPETPSHADYLNHVLGRLCENDAFLKKQAEGLALAGVRELPGSARVTEEIELGGVE